MKEKNAIGLEKNYTNEVSGKLNLLLANYQMYYQNLRGFHWNISGSEFFELHAKFEELYNQANVNVDEIAERILTLGGEPLHTFSEYIEKATIKAAQGVSDGKETTALVIENLSEIVRVERELLAMASAADDEGTATLMSDDIKLQEKTIWMFNAYKGR